MNGLEIYLSKRVYKPGENVYGAIFLKLIKPTELDAINVQLDGRLTFKSSNITIKKDLSQTPLQIFSFSSLVNVGFYAFPFCLALPEESLCSICLSSSTKTIGSFILELEYTVLAFASVCSFRLLQCCSNLFVFSLPPISRLDHFNDSVVLDSNGITLNLSVSLRSTDPLAVFVSALKTNDDTIAHDVISGTNISTYHLFGFSVNISLERNHYELGDCITIVSASKTSRDIHIDSICFRLVRYIELNPDLFELSPSSPSNSYFEKICSKEVLFGSLLPAVTEINEDFEINLAQLHLPAFLPEAFTPTVGCIFFSCHYEIEVSINFSSAIYSGDEKNPSSRNPGDVYEPITFSLPISIIPPKESTTFSRWKMKSIESSWLPLCLVALSDEESVSDRKISPGKNFISVFRQSNFFWKPCQTITFVGAKRGPAGLSPRSVRGIVDFSRIPVFRHLGATTL